MAEVKMQFRGWQAIVVVALLIALVGYRFVSQKDMTGDTELVQKVRQELMFDVYPDQARRLQAAQAAGDTERLEALARQVSDTQLEILSLEASQPLFDFSSPREVVVKVDYLMKEGGTSESSTTAYLLYEYHSLGNNWRHIRSSTAMSYYLNFF